MKPLSSRILFFVMVPAMVGGGAGWVTRPGANGKERSQAAGAEKSLPSTPAAAVGKPGGTGEPADSALAGQRRFCEKLLTADLPGMMVLLEETQALTDSLVRRSSRTLVLEQMARTDPAAAWLLLETWEKGSCRKPFLQAWAQVDAEGALMWAEGQGKDGVDFAREIVNGLVPDNMAAFAKILPRLKPEQISTEQVASAFRLLAGGDPAAAVKLLDGLGGTGRKRNTGLSSVGEGWGRRDPAAAYAWAKELPDPSQRESALRGVFRAWAETDPKGTAARLDELTKDPELAKSAAGDSPVRAVVRAWAAQDPRSAAAWLRERTAASGDSPPDATLFQDLLKSEILSTRDEWNALEVADLIRRPGEMLTGEKGDPAKAFSRATRWGDGDEYGEVIGPFGDYNSPLKSSDFFAEPDAAVRIANPAQAFDDLARQPGDASRQHVLHEVAAQWAAHDPEAAMAKLRETTDPWLKLGLINALSKQARQNHDPQLAAEIAAMHPENSHGGKQIVGEVYASLARTDPTRARALLDSDLAVDGKISVASALATRQATYDPAGALGWAAQQADEKVRLEATRSALSSWAGADAYAASEWLAAQPGGPLREAAVQGLVQTLRENSPADALQWAGTLTDPSQRENEQFGIVQNLIWQDPARAKELMGELKVSEPQRALLNEMIRSRERNGF